MNIALDILENECDVIIPYPKREEFLNKVKELIKSEFKTINKDENKSNY